MRRVYKSDNNIADGAGIDPDKQKLMRRLKAGENVLTRVRQEKNNLQDANTQLGEELRMFVPSCLTPLRRIGGFDVAFLVSA